VTRHDVREELLMSRPASYSAIRLVESSAAHLRLDAARSFLKEHARTSDVLVVGASRGAVDDLVRGVIVQTGAAVGIHRFSLTQLAARLAAPVLADEERAPVTQLGSEAVAARAAFEAGRDGALQYFAPVARTPGFPRALGRTLQELRLADVTSDRLSGLPLGGADLAALLDRFDAQFAAAAATDRAALFEAAALALRGRSAWADSLRRLPVLLLDVPIDSRAEQMFVAALLEIDMQLKLRATNAARAPAPAHAHATNAARAQSKLRTTKVLITMPFGDVAALDRFRELGIEPDVLEQQGPTDLAALWHMLFRDYPAPERTSAGDVVFFSAPGEGRECVEIARRILREARAGVAFDDMAVFVRAPQRYAGLLEHALSRAGVPAWFDRGTTRPHPAGRAFIAILSCACEKLSARRFAEYLSLAQVPQLTAPPRGDEPFTPQSDEAIMAFATVSGEGAPPVRGDDDPPESANVDTDEEAAVVAGALRAPWKWETLIVESAVIGGDPARWHRRLDGLAQSYRRKMAEERRSDPDSPRAARFERDLRNLGHLRAFALPIIDRIARWAPTGTWREWIDRFAELAPLVLRRPERVLRVLAELRPMGDIGPVSLEEARDVLAERLLTLEVEPAPQRYGAVFVGSPHQARGRAFKVVFVPGLAERVFPQRPHEDPLLLDKEMRAPLHAGLALQENRARAERLLLRLAVGAATERLWLSYPRLDVSESRPRVPSFYALDVLRAVTGLIPNHDALQESAAARGGAGLGWPAPAAPDDAIDDAEHDLSVLKQLLDAEPPASVRGHAHYLLRLNDALKRSVTRRWARGRSQWTPSDGITRVTGMTKPLLEAKRLGAQPYSLSSLQRYASCPYQFLLASILRLAPFELPEPLERLDPLTRGSIFHEMQAELFRALQAAHALPVTSGSLAHALDALDGVIARVAAHQKDKLAPAIDRVWDSEVADIAKDLRVWLRRVSEAPEDWRPEYFELSFGLADREGRDPRSRTADAVVDGRFHLRGSIDLVERNAAGLLRVTDHKTGKNRTTWKTVIGGGTILQPVLYSLAVEQVLGGEVAVGRLFYCTSVGGFTDHPIPINDMNRRSGVEALEIIDRAIELGFLPAAPDERACTWCDFRAVCGPHEYQRVSRKAPEKLGDLEELRSRP
jgi:CRISPR/Cas system-associated exonuclease Cas4 (RecB family)